MVLPLHYFTGNSTAEKLLWERCKQYLPRDYVSFHNYYLGAKQADVILLVPRFGVLVLEIKGIHVRSIADVPDRSVIRLIDGTIIQSPFDQAIKYRNILLDILSTSQGIESVYVAAAVCYPFISRQEYRETGLDRISPEQLTITAEDLKNGESFLRRIEDIFVQLYRQVQVPALIPYGFDNRLMKQVGNAVSPGFRNAQREVPSQPIPPVTAARGHYSRLYYVPGSRFTLSLAQEIAELWGRGSKIYFYSDSSEAVRAVRRAIEETICVKGLCDRDAFVLNGGSTFLFTSSVVDGIKTGFTVTDGAECKQYLEELQQLHKCSNFNFDQYRIEHAPLVDIIVKAGAGTGKTYSIISRINYLIWIKGYSSASLCRSIAMITFTNKSADDMKEKLSSNFLKYFLLTKDTRYLDMIECVEDMKIATIHAMSKKILSAYASRLGLGKDFRIISGEYQRAQYLHANLNKYLQRHPKLARQTSLSMFLLSKRLLGLIKKLDSKNVDILADRIPLDFGVSNKVIFNDLLGVIRDTQRDMNTYCSKNNAIVLGDLIRKLGSLCEILRKEQGEGVAQVDFLFVDEFQDTDDVQIQLMKSLRNVFGYRFFVVGDIKQCIYRFRGAQTKAFDTLTEGQSPMTVITLEKNYRTDSGLLDKLNNSFVDWNEKGDLDYPPEDVLSGTKALNPTPQLYKIPATQQEYEEKLTKAIKKCCRQLPDPGDKVAILVRFNSQIVAIKAICERYGIAVDTEIGGDLFRIDPTIDFFKLLLALRFNQSPGHLYNLYTTSYICDNMDKIELWREDDGSEIAARFYANPPHRLAKWQEYLIRITQEPILKVLRDIVDDAKPWEIFADKSGAEGQAAEQAQEYYLRNLDQLFENLVSASNTDYLTINKLSDYLEIMILTRQEEESRASFDLERSTNNVICTNVHKAKGLEFDTVILPYSDFDLSSTKPKGDVDLIYVGNSIGYRINSSGYRVEFKNDLYDEFMDSEITDRRREETRILYVALTRAKRRVVMFTPPNGARKPQHCWDAMVKE